MNRAVVLLTSLLTGSLAAAQPVPPATSTKPPPPVQLVLGPRQAITTPVRQGVAYTGGGIISVVQPAPDTLVVTMSGSVAAIRHFLCDSLAAMNFELTQAFDIVAQRGVDAVELQVEGRMIGLLRSQCHECCKGTAFAGVTIPGQAVIRCGPADIINLGITPVSIAAGDNLAVNVREGPQTFPIVPGTYTLHQVFGISASHPKSLHLCRSVSADFGPAAPPRGWIGREDPFRGFAREGFGFQIILRAVAR